MATSSVPRGQGGGSGRRNFNTPAKETSVGPSGSTRKGSRSVEPEKTPAQKAAISKAAKDDQAAKTKKANQSKTNANADKKLKAQKTMFRDLVNNKGMSHTKAHEAVVDKHGWVPLSVLKRALAGGK